MKSAFVLKLDYDFSIILLITFMVRSSQFFHSGSVIILPLQSRLTQPSPSYSLLPPTVLTLETKFLCYGDKDRD